MESSNIAVRQRNAEAAAKELRELREDTIKGLNFALDHCRDSLEDGAGVLAAAIDIVGEQGTWVAA